MQRTSHGTRAAWGRVAAAAALLVVAAGCGLTGGHDDAVAPRAAVPAGAAATSDSPYLPDPAETTGPPATESTRRPAKKPKPTVKATPAEDPNNFQAPACARHEGTEVSKKKAKSALVAAAGRTYWPTNAPQLRLPGDLVRSIAWHESGWQSDIVNCDGGRGLMQVMPDTVSMINTRFGESYDARDYRQNALAGANYLAWLSKYFGERYFKNKYNLSTGACRTHASPCLPNMVIAGYNSGFGAVDESYGSDRSLPNPEYVDSVRSLMSSCYCDRY